MEQNLISKVIQINGMVCPSCEMKIENKLKAIEGVECLEVSYSKESVNITYNPIKINLSDIIRYIEKLDYKVLGIKNTVHSKNFGITKLLGIGIILFAIYIFIKSTIGFNFIPTINQNMGYGILFIVGILTSIHCISMCGGINLSQCIQNNLDEDNMWIKLKPSILYNLGRVTSYTLIGGIVGAIGSVISFSGTAQGLVSIFAGIFMLIMGLNMLNIFPSLRNLIPTIPKSIGNKIYNNNRKYNSYYIGVLNGLMPCGPLQSMQIYALGTGSFITGALSMFIFSLGTVPLMFGLGAISSILSNNFTQKMMKVSAALVMFLGVIMLNRGFALSGFDPLNVFAATNSNDISVSGAVANVTKDVQYITTNLDNGRYKPITVQKGIPVKWTIEAGQRDINGCNNAINIPEYGIRGFELKSGENIIEFTPDKSGTFVYTCWMGMIRSKITVVDDLSKVSQVDDNEYVYNNNPLGRLYTDIISYSIPTDDIQIGTLVDGVQELTVKIDNGRYSPAVVVIERDKEFLIKFISEDLDKNGQIVYFPDYRGGIDLTENSETPILITPIDTSFENEFGTMYGYIKVVENINDFDIDQVIKDVENFTPNLTNGSCCN